MFTFNHFNFNVKNLEESLKFYHDALGLEEISRNDQPDFTIVFLGDGKTGFRLELTYMKGRTKPYDLGEQEAHAYHKKNGWICFENTAMGIYFLEDPDGYWIEIVPDGAYMAARTKE